MPWGNLFSQKKQIPIANNPKISIHLSPTVLLERDVKTQYFDAGTNVSSIRLHPIFFSSALQSKISTSYFR